MGRQSGTKRNARMNFKRLWRFITMDSSSPYHWVQEAKIQHINHVVCAMAKTYQQGVKQGRFSPQDALAVFKLPSSNFAYSNALRTKPGSITELRKVLVEALKVAVASNDFDTVVALCTALVAETSTSSISDKNTDITSCMMTCG